MLMSIQKFNILVKKNKISVIFLYSILIFQFVIPLLNSSGMENSSYKSNLLLNNFIDDEVFLIIGKSDKFASNRLNGRELKNERETNQIIEKIAFCIQIDLNNYLSLELISAYLEIPDIINSIPRSPPQFLS